MRKSRKAVLASAIFVMSVLASCGGGGGGSGTGTGGGSLPTDVGSPPGTGGGSPGTDTGTSPGTGVSGETVKVLAQTLSGNKQQIVICDLKPDNTISCGKDINPDANIRLMYLHELSDGTTVLVDNNNKVYYFDQATGTLNKLTSGKDVDGNPINNQLDLSGYTRLYGHPNYAVLTGEDYNTDHLFITKSGQYIQKPNSNYSLLTLFKGKNTILAIMDIFHTYRIDANGNVSEIMDNGTPVQFQKFLITLGDNILFHDATNSINLLKDDGTLLKLDTISEPADAQMVKVGNDFYVAVRDGTNLYYYRNNKKLLNSPIALGSNANRTYYALDGSGNLYYYDGSNVKVITTGLVASSNAQAISSFGGLIGTSVGVIASDTANNQLYLLSTSGNTITSKTSTDTNLLNAVNTCINGKSQIKTGAVKDEGTNKVMCVGSNGDFSGIIYNNGNYIGKKITAVPSFARVSFITFGINGAMVEDDSSPANTEMCSLNSINSKCVVVPRGWYKRLDGDIMAAFKDGTFYLVDPVAGTSNPIFTGAIYATGGNVSYDIKIAAAVYKTTDSQCPSGYGNVIKLYKDGKEIEYKSNNLCFDGKLLKVYKWYYPSLIEVLYNPHGSDVTLTCNL